MSDIIWISLLISSIILYWFLAYQFTLGKLLKNFYQRNYVKYNQWRWKNIQKSDLGVSRTIWYHQCPVCDTDLKEINQNLSNYQHYKCPAGHYELCYNYGFFEIRLYDQHFDFKEYDEFMDIKRDEEFAKVKHIATILKQRRLP